MVVSSTALLTFYAIFKKTPMVIGESGNEGEKRSNNQIPMTNNQKISKNQRARIKSNLKYGESAFMRVKDFQIRSGTN
jgi:hypothetical protein